MKKNIKGIIAEMREFIKNPTIGTKTECEVKLENYLKGCMKDYADRIEEAVAKMETTTSTCKDSLQVGNAAKMRETLMEVKRTLQYLYRPERASFEGDNRRIVDAVRIIDAALSAPPSNCDRFATQSQMSEAYEKYRKSAMKKRGSGIVGDVPFIKPPPMSYDEWMFAVTTN